MKASKLAACHPSLVLALLLVSLAGRAFALQWTSAREGMASLNAAAASPSTYVLAGKFGDIWSSTDGGSWTRRTTPTGVNQDLYGAVYAGGQFVLVGAARCCGSDQSAMVLTSPD